MTITLENLTDMFTFHKPRCGDAAAYTRVRKAGRQFSEVILNNTRSSADQSAAIRKVREAVMTANAAIALRGRV